jgi:GxxExxY protein
MRTHTGFRKIDLVYPELCYKIIGAAFNVYNTLGHGHYEKYYQRALAEEFKNQHLSFKEQLFSPLKFGNITIGKNTFDFLVDDKVIVEIKKNERFSRANINQVVE